MAEIMPTYPEGTRQWAEGESKRLWDLSLWHEQEAIGWYRRWNDELDHENLLRATVCGTRHDEHDNQSRELLDQAEALDAIRATLPLGEPIYSRDELRAAGQKWFRFPRRKLC